MALGDCVVFTWDATFSAQAVAAVTQITDDYEIIFVVDASPDDSLALALELQRKDPRIAVLELARNYGQNKALMMGVAASAIAAIAVAFGLEQLRNRRLAKKKTSAGARAMAVGA